MKRADGRMGRQAVVAGLTTLVLSVGPSARLAAQDSQFGIRGLGTPGKSESVRARTTGGAFAPFDAFSPLTDASLADVRRLSAGVTTGATWRSLNFTGGPDTSLQATRFPALVIVGPASKRFVVGGGFSTYLDRTFGTITHDTIILRGNPEGITDEIRSDGAVTDVRLAVAARVNSRLNLGLGIHRMTGSSRMVAIRTFSDTINYRTSTARDEVAYGGNGASVSALLDLTGDLRVAGWFRSDGSLRADLSGKTVAENDLPVSYGTGVEWRPGSAVAVAGTLAWANWDTGANAGPNSHNTFSWSLGTELGRPTAPFRFGVRHGQMAFGIGTTPTEFGITGGLGRQFSGGRGRLDLGIEHLRRKGTGLNERTWTLLLGLTVRP